MTDPNLTTKQTVALAAIYVVTAPVTVPLLAAALTYGFLRKALR